MHAGICLPKEGGVCPSACWDMSAQGGGCLSKCMLGYVCSGRGVSVPVHAGICLPGWGGGFAPVHAGIYPPVNRMTDRQV